MSEISKVSLLKLVNEYQGKLIKMVKHEDGKNLNSIITQSPNYYYPGNQWNKLI